jgi:beta-alanine degradation protein BauB
MTDDPVATNPNLYQVVMENERVRVLEYRDHPGDRSTPHRHPDSVMITLSSFRRRLVDRDRQAEVELDAGVTLWLAAQTHSGENIGDTETHVIFVELKRESTTPSGEVQLGPAT